MTQTDRRAFAETKPPSFADIVADYEAAKTHEIPIDDKDPRLGNPTAALRIVLFSDFECPACRRFAATIDHIRDHHPEISVVYKHYPLGKSCNDELDFDLHPLSCDAAHAAQAAHRQGKFWQYHDALFAANEELQPVLLEQVAKNLELDIQQFKKDWNDAETADKIRDDVSLGNKLKLDGTPTILLNDKLVSAEAMSYLEELIGHLGGHAHDTEH